MKIKLFKRKQKKLNSIELALRDFTLSKKIMRHINKVIELLNTTQENSGACFKEVLTRALKNPNVSDNHRILSRILSQLESEILE